MEEKIVDLYYYRVTVSIDNKISIEKKKFNAILAGHNYVILGEDKGIIGFTPRKYFDQMRKNGYWFYSLRGDYTNEEILDQFTPYIKEEKEYHEKIVKNLEEQLFNCLYYD